MIMDTPVLLLIIVGVAVLAFLCHHLTNVK